MSEPKEIPPGFHLTAPLSVSENYVIKMRVHCEWYTYLADGTEAAWEAEFEGLPTDEQVYEGAKALAEFAEAMEVEEPPRPC